MLINSNSTVYQMYHRKTPDEVRAAQEMQESAKEAAKAGQSGSNVDNGTSAFLSNAMEQLLANKIGVDKEKLDELKKEIEALQKLENPTKEQSERLVMLTEKLEALVKEASERAAEQETKREPDNKLKTYQSIAAMTSLL